MAKRKLWLRGTILLVLALFGWALFLSSEQIDRNKRIEDEVALLQSEADKIRQENKSLSERISYFSSQDFQEQEARKKLGLKKAEEEVVVIKPAVVSGGADAAPAMEQSMELAIATDRPTYLKWWQLFFRQSS